MRRFSLVAAEQWALLGILLFLPSIEAPKNIAAFFYLLFWVMNRARSGEWGGTWSRWETAVLALIIGAYASSAFGLFTPEKGISAGHDVLTYGLVFLAVRRARYAEAFLWRALLVAILATLLTLAHGYWGVYVTGQRQTLGLHSVGHVNHSAIYVAIIFGLAFSWLLARWTSAASHRWTLAAAVLVLWVSLFISEARGAIIPAVLLVFILPYLLVNEPALRRKARWLLPVIMVGGALLLVPKAIQKTQSNMEAGVVASYRPALARTALLGFREAPVFGIGITCFGRISPELASDWQTQRGEWFAPDTLYFSSHAHNLYANTLAERGLVGFVPLLVFLGLCLRQLLESRRGLTAIQDPLASTLWGAAFGAWWVTVVGGLFNTSLHHEHALITMVLIALWLGHENSRHSHG